MTKTKRRFALVAILAASTLGLSASPAFAWHTQNPNVVDGGKWLYGAVTVCVKSSQWVQNQWRLDGDYGQIRHRTFDDYVGRGCTRLGWRSRDDLPNGWYSTRIRTDVQKD